MRAHLLTLPANAEIGLLIEGVPVCFAKMRDGRDGRATPGLRPADATSKSFWDRMQERRGETVRIDLYREDGSDGGTSGGPGSGGPSLGDLAALLGEWDSAEDSAAYDGL